MAAVSLSDLPVSTECYAFETEQTDQGDTAAIFDYVPIDVDPEGAEYEGSLSDAVESDSFFELSSTQFNAAYAATYPSGDALAYLTGKYPSTRLQFSGSCWAFAAVANIEFSGITNGVIKTGKSTDLSEYAFGYYATHFVEDPLGGTKGDNYRFTDSSWYAAGHNSNFTMHTMNQWLAATTAQKVPTPDDLNAGVDKSKAYDNDYLVTDVRILNILDDPKAVKAAILSNGSVSVSYHQGADANAYNSKYNSYYCSQNLGIDHEAVIVGWDDNFSTGKFNKKPAKKGAWLVRNSWSNKSVYSNQSYFWMSYCDKSLHWQAFSYSVAPATDYDHNYQYDGTNCATAGHFGSRAAEPVSVNAPKSANVFKAKGRTEAEMLSAVNLTFTDVTDLNYRIEIYVNPTDSSNPTGGRLVSSATTTGKTSYAGIYTIPLKNPVILNHGDSFAVVVTAWKKDGTRYYYYQPDRESLYTGWAGMTGSVAVPDDSSYLYDGTDWNELTVEELQDTKYGNLRIKAFTSDYSLNGAPAAVRLSQTSLNLNKGAKATLSAVVTPKNAINFSKIKWTSSNNSIATVSNGTITGKVAGTAKITAQALDKNGQAIPGVKAVCNVRVCIPVSKITLSEDVMTFRVNETRSLKAIIAPNNATLKTVTWTTSDNYVAKVDAKGRVTGVGQGTAVITAKCGGKTVKCKVQIRSLYDPIVVQASATTNRINLKWNPVNLDFIDGYEICYAPSANGDYVCQKYVAGVRSRSYSITEVVRADGVREKIKPGKTYYFAVCSAFWRGSTLLFYPTLASKTKAVTKPAKVTGLQKVKTTRTSIKLKWKKSSGATGYYVYVATSKNGKYKKVATLKGCSKTAYTYKKLKSRKKYYFKIVAYKTGNQTYRAAASKAIAIRTK